MNTIYFSDPEYPNILKQIYKPPQKLYYKGNLNLLKKVCISIVGTRRNSEYGEYITEKLIEEISILDIAIVSGLAKGIDTIAHKAALTHKIPTIAVLGSGINNIYPKSNINLANQIEFEGLIISEHPGETEPLPGFFPQRNRIISGLSVATLVVEAPEKSGALITSKYALEQGREIFVIPGDVHRKNSQGIINLLQRGAAYPIASGKDLIEELSKQPHLFPVKQTKTLNNKSAPLFFKLTPEEKKILTILNQYRGKTIEQLQKSSYLPIKTILAILSMLEIQELIYRKEGKYIRKIKIV